MREQKRNKWVVFKGTCWAPRPIAVGKLEQMIKLFEAYQATSEKPTGLVQYDTFVEYMMTIGEDYD